MKPVFADTFFFLALARERDRAHARAVDYSQSQHGLVVTTAWVLTEVANSLSRRSKRSRFSTLLDGLRRNPRVTIVPPTQELFDKGVELYAERSDKDWSLTDCVSFVVMRKLGLTEALTGDRHFEQAGFKALLA